MKKRRIISLTLCLALALSALIFPSLAADATPDAVPDITGVKIVDIQSYTHTLALDDNGNVWAWGLNSLGQWGIGFAGEAPAYMHVQVLDLSDVIQIGVGNEFSVALKSNGTVWSWGFNSMGQLGNGTTINQNLPVQVNDLQNVNQISIGQYHSLALREDGTVWAWGMNSNGQLGDGSAIDRSTPVRVNGLNDVIAVSAGVRHSLALRQDGTVWAWGQNTNGDLGIGTMGDQWTPAQVSRLLNIKQIEAAHFSNTALKEDGTIWTWGVNVYGQVGDGTTTNRTAPVQLNLTDIQTLTAYRSVFAQAEDGTVWTWGYNRYGNLCLEDQVDRETPTQVPLGQMAQVLSVSMTNTFFVRQDGSIWGCGQNHYGQLRMDEPTEIVITPIEIFPPGTYTGPGVTPIDPPDPDDHTVTLVETYADNSQPQNTTTYPVAHGDDLNEPLAVPDGYLLDTVRVHSATAATATVSASAGTLRVDNVTGDVRVEITYAPGSDPVDPPDPDTFTVTLTQTWADGAQSDIVLSESKASGAAYYKTFAIPDGYTAAMTYTGSTPSFNATTGAVHIGSVLADTSILITYTPE